MVNKITTAPLAGALVTVGDTSASTDEKGIATVVLPIDNKELDAKVTFEGYNDTNAKIKVTTEEDENTISITPKGTIYYLSKESGKIDVMRSNLDGTKAKVVVAGTGNENDRSTVLLASRDWHYLALYAKREAGEKRQLFLYDTHSGQLKLMDEGGEEVNFRLTGWSGHRFIYTAVRYDLYPWQNGSGSLKSYDAETGVLKKIDQNAASGSNSYNYAEKTVTDSPYILGDRIVYGETWNFGTYRKVDKLSAIVSINADGSDKRRLKELPISRRVYMQAKIYAPQEIYFRAGFANGKSKFYEYENGVVEDADQTDEKFYNTTYPTFLVSPDSQKTFWGDARNGKNTLFVGDSSGEDEQTVATLSEYAAYGWYGDDYILLSKDGSELYIASANQKLNNKPLKVTDYHKPDLSYPGYGYGYGGI